MSFDIIPKSWIKTYLRQNQLIIPNFINDNIFIFILYLSFKFVFIF